jgi:ubiquinol-cytochrome c reductase cytochrome c subunit
MKRAQWLAGLAAAGFILTIAAANAQTAAPASQGNTVATGNAQNGKDLYSRYSCYACHGYAGHAGPGGRLVPMRMNLPGFTAFVRNPRRMPPYSAKALSDAQLADVWAYIKSLPESPAAKSIPLLNQLLNEK